MSIREFYKGKKVFVTGHTGFKGSWMCEMLLMMGADVYGYALKPPIGPSLFKILNLSERMQSEIGDVGDFWHLYAVMLEVRPELVIHMAAQPIVRLSYEQPRQTYETNVLGTVNLLDALKRVDSVRSFVNVTTDKVYRNDGRTVGYAEDAVLDGFDPYSNSKSCSELVTGCYKRSFFYDTDTAVSTVRAGNVIGGGDFAKDRLIPDAFRALASKQELVVRNPSYIRPFWHVLDACFAYLLLAARQYENGDFAGNYNIGPDENEVWKVGNIVKEFSEEVSKLTDLRLDVKCGSSDELHEDAALLLNSDKFKSFFSWKPVWDTKEAIAKSAEWYGCFLQGGDVERVTQEQIGGFWNIDLCTF